MEIKEKFDPSKLFFTSDTHYYHPNIVKYFNRPWGDSRTHDSALIQNWNRVVPKDGKVFHLGDLALTSRVDYLKELIGMLNGTIYFVAGNHDYRNKYQRQVVIDLFGGRFYDIAEIIVSDHMRIQMCHYPFFYWRRDSIHLHGHVHSGEFSPAYEIVPPHIKRYDVGVDNNNYTPISYYELIEKLDIKMENFLNDLNVE